LSGKRQTWIICQIGAREHYALPRGLFKQDRLAALLTDAWLPPGSIGARLSQRGRGRFHSDLPSDKVISFTAQSSVRELRNKIFSRDTAQSILTRNAWFQRQVVQEMHRLSNADPKIDVVFSYSYAAAEIFREARRRGWMTVLGQIDPGPFEGRLVESLSERHGIPDNQFSTLDKGYWESWKAETELADLIAVNSEWSRQALLKEGVIDQKIVVVPLAYDSGERRLNHRHAFRSPETRLKVLFLGQAILRKGIIELIEAAERLRGTGVEICVVGAANPEIAARLQSSPDVRWLGAQPRSQVHTYYADCDIFILPTHSDGFGLTQYEALAHGVPVIASPFCGNVVTHEVNGLVLPDVSSISIASTLKRLAGDPQLLKILRDGARQSAIPSPTDIGQRLVEIVDNHRNRKMAE